MECYMCKFFAVTILVFCQYVFAMSQDQHGISTDSGLVALSQRELAGAVVHLNEIAENDKCEYAMRMFHEAYGTLAEIGLGKGIYFYANEKCPGFVNYYRKWLCEHDFKEPVIGLLRENW